MTSQILSIIFALVLIAFTGCQSHNARADGIGGAPMTAGGELAALNPRPMDAQAQFFAGQIHVEVMLATSDVTWKNVPDEASSRSEEGRGKSGSGGGFNGGMGGRRGGGGSRGKSGEDKGGGSDSSEHATAERPTMPTPRASNAPPVQLRLRFSNGGGQPLDVEVLDFNSELGNFSVQPTNILLPANATAEADPMTSRLGVPAVEEIPLTVRLRVGGKKGQTETQVLKLHPRSETPAVTATKP